MKDLLNYYSKVLILQIYNYSDLHKLILSYFDILIEYTLIEDNFDETNLRNKEILVNRDYSNNKEIGFIDKNNENEKKVNYRGHRDLRILTSYGLPCNTGRKELPVSGNVEVSKRGNKEKGYNSIRFAQKDRAMRLYSKGVKIRNYCTTRPSDEKLVELEINGLTDIFNLDTRYFVATGLNIDNPYDFKDSSLSEKEQNLLANYIDDYDDIQIESFCINHLKKSTYSLNFAIKLLNKYAFGMEVKYELDFAIKLLNKYASGMEVKYDGSPDDVEDLPILIENPFVACGHLQSVQKYLEISKLKLNTLDDFCQGIIYK
jgi:hypothetical protein